MANKIIKDREVLKPFELSRRILPSKHECLLYVVSLSNQCARKISHKSAVYRLAKLCEEIWNKADCCAYWDKTIIKLFESEIWDKYKFLLRELYLPWESLPSTRKRSIKKTHLNRSNGALYFSVLTIYLNFPHPFSYPK